MQNTALPPSDEIDLFELFATLWKKKLTIILFTICTIALAAAYAFTAKEAWTSKAQVVPAKAIQLGAYLEAERRYYRYADIEKDFDLQGSLNNAFASFIQTLHATDNRLAFFKDSAYYQAITADITDETSKQLQLENIAFKDTKIQETVKNKKDSFDISFTAETAHDAHDTLAKFITHSNQVTQQKLFEDFFERVEDRIATLEQSVLNTQKETEQNRKNQIEQFKQALQAAQSAGISDYKGQTSATMIVDLTNNNIVDLTNNNSLFLLGTNYLQAQLNALNNSPLIYAANYYQTKENIQNLKQILTIKPGGETFEFTRSPSLPLTKDKSKKALILLAGAVLGGILGCLFVLLQQALRSRRQTN